MVSGQGAFMERFDVLMEKIYTCILRMIKYPRNVESLSFKWVNSKEIFMDMYI